ncbi:unnamed protein product [Arctia plantaginis]|uniref:Uncharacterized protein n=1 Tax=Arctia plantaginis TaxID=874455 RepID=A0A8S1ASM6_ARCPL|nr:unnamed protein product [Arctia plantaginis]
MEVSLIPDLLSRFKPFPGQSSGTTPWAVNERSRVFEVGTTAREHASTTSTRRKHVRARRLRRRDCQPLSSLSCSVGLRIMLSWAAKIALSKLRDLGINRVNDVKLRHLV